MAAHTEQDGSERMPAGLRAGLLVLLLAAMASALYLIWVRGDALLVDLQALGQRIWCF